MIELEHALGMLNVARAKYFIERDGKDLPVTNLFDSEGVEVRDSRDAFWCVVYDESLPGDKWAVYRLDPGELMERRP